MGSQRVTHDQATEHARMHMNGISQISSLKVPADLSKPGFKEEVSLCGAAAGAGALPAWWGWEHPGMR